MKYKKEYMTWVPWSSHGMTKPFRFCNKREFKQTTTPSVSRPPLRQTKGIKTTPAGVYVFLKDYFSPILRALVRA